ncbi:MAG: wax ester/triacylglycerol synthase family O-acyltransferase [Caldilineaceae bacterium]
MNEYGGALLNGAPLAGAPSAQKDPPMAPSTREPMRNVDKAWLDMDSPTNPMIINGMMLFEEVIDFERAVGILEERLVARYARFRQRVVNSAGPGLSWEEDPHFDLRTHIRHIALPAPGDMATMQHLISDLASETLEPRRPLWRFYIIENVAGGSAVFGRIHHSIADGVALVQVLLSLTDDQAASAPRPFPVNEPPPVRRSHGLMARLRDNVRSGARMAARGVALALHETAATIDRPSRLADGLYHAGLITLTGAAIVGKLLLIPPDNDSVFKGNLGAYKRVAWSEPIALADVKALGRSAGATVNDVLVAAVAGALRRYMLEHGGAIDIRSMIPVNLRDLNKPIVELGNQFALVYLSLPLEMDRPAARLQAVKEQMDVLKQSPEPLIVYEILSILGMAPGEIADYATNWFSSKASAVLTNVPGPREPIYFGGLPIKRVLFWVPQTGRIGLGVSIISYNGEVTLGVMADEGLVGSPERILDAFAAELRSLRADVISEVAAVDEAVASEVLAAVHGTPVTSGSSLRPIAGAGAADVPDDPTVVGPPQATATHHDAVRTEGSPEGTPDAAATAQAPEKAGTTTESPNPAASSNGQVNRHPYVGSEPS